MILNPQPKRKKAQTKDSPHAQSLVGVRDVAKALYVNANMIPEQIAADLGVTAEAVTQWKVEDKWEEERQIKNLTPENLMQRLYQQSDDIIMAAENESRHLSVKECDAILKISKAISQLGNRLDPSTLMQAFMKLNNYIAAIDVDLARKVIPYQKELLQGELKKSV